MDDVSQCRLDFLKRAFKMNVADWRQYGVQSRQIDFREDTPDQVIFSFDQTLKSGAQLRHQVTIADQALLPFHLRSYDSRGQQLGLARLYTDANILQAIRARIEEALKSRFMNRYPISETPKAGGQNNHCYGNNLHI